MLKWFSDGLGKSGVSDVSFYFESGLLGVSDNHRMAYPFFARKASEHSVLMHMDSHEDCAFFREEDKAELAKIDAVADLDAFVSYQYEYNGSAKCPVQWGNWITALLHMFPQLFDRIYIICQGRCTSTSMYTEAEKRVLRRAQNEDSLWSSAETAANSACFSLDVDYYYDCASERYFVRPGFPNPTAHFGRCLRRALDSPGSPLFVALSPSCCGGWENVMPFIQVIDQCCGISLAAQVEARL